MSCWQPPIDGSLHTTGIRSVQSWCRCMSAENRAPNGAQWPATIEREVAGDDWILVHDAARPCVTSALLDRLIGEIGADQIGGLLAVPVADTLKRANSNARVVATEPRAGLWQAQTPQMFRMAC